MIEDYYGLNPYELAKEEKTKMLTKELIELTEFHREHCPEYRNIVGALNYDAENVQSYYDIPFFPVRLFKEMDLISIERDKLFKTMTSSGTTGQHPSKIFLDKDTAITQQKVMIKILGDYFGKHRVP